MNKLQTNVLEALVSIKVMRADYIPTALYEALDCSEHSIEDAIIELLEDGAYLVPDEMALSVDSIDVILGYAKEVELTLEFGFGSVLESYVISKLDDLLGTDLLETM